MQNRITAGNGNIEIRRSVVNFAEVLAVCHYLLHLLPGHALQFLAAFPGKYINLSDAPHAVPQAALFCALSCLFHPKRFANAIFITSCNIKIWGFALLQDHHNKTANL